jgi:hypothetical protein
MSRSGLALLAGAAALACLCCAFGAPRARTPAGAPALPAARAEAAVDYNRDIQPLLSDRCFACHGPDASRRQAGLRLDRRADALRSLAPGDPRKSRVLSRVASREPDEVMPPPDANKSALTAEQVALVRRWIEQGAAYETHWAFQKPTRPPTPQVKRSGWVRNPIDSFVAAGHDRRGLTPAPEADRVTLLRRLSFDLTGLPPTPREVDAFVADPSPDAYEQAVDRLLASPHFGERMAVLWLDLARYADTDGYSIDAHRDVWPYRDYVIDSFNRNRPFDIFTIQQLAGDLLPAPTREDRIASGYNRLLMTAQEGCADPKEYVVRYAADRVRNVSGAWLGLTLGCAECHDHKFDPLSQRDFYRLAAVFADIQEKGVGPQEPTRFYRDAEEESRAKALDAEAGVARTAVVGLFPGAAWSRALRRWGRIEAERQAVLDAIPASLVSASGPPRVVRVLRRGDWNDESGPVVESGFPALLTAPPSARRLTRLDLARWLASPDNPLTARVFVNRLWQLAFGKGLVGTPDDFGAQGAPPTHPELLDWLAVEFAEGGWDVKATLRLILTSSAYRQASNAGAEARERDPDNRWLARQNRFRLDAEFVRDNALAVAGLLSPRVGGRSVKPDQPEGFWAQRFTEKDYRPDEGEGRRRRGVYTYWCRNYLHPALQVFDAPARQVCAAERGRSVTPLQALALLNDPTQGEAARALAQRILTEGGRTVVERLDYAYRLVLSRHVRPQEAALLADLIERHWREYREDPEAAARLVGVGGPPDLDLAELAAWTSAARVLLNLHETITRS